MQKINTAYGSRFYCGFHIPTTKGWQRNNNGEDRK
jgi:hypothetical protein